MRHLFLAAATLAIASCSDGGQSYPEPSTPIEALEQAVLRAADTGKAGAILEVQGCGLSFQHAEGIANRKTKTPMPLNEPLRIASIGKLYTAAVIHKLAQQGMLDLNLAATHYLNAGEIAGVPNADATLLQLLNHTSGIPDYYDARSYFFTDWTQPITVEQTLKVARRKGATNAPGEAYAYSNTNFQILSLVAEKVTGQTFTQLINSQLLEPLQLNQTKYNTSHPGGTIHGYGTELRKNADTWKYAENTGADGGVTATSSDLSRYMKALFLESGDLNAIGSAMQTKPLVEIGARQFSGAGVELRETRSGIRMFGYTGDTMGYLTFAYAIPEHDVTLVGHINSSNEDGFVELLKTATLTVVELCQGQGG